MAKVCGYQKNSDCNSPQSISEEQYNEDTQTETIQQEIYDNS